LRGWIAHCLPPPMPLAEGNIGALAERLGMAPVAIVAPDASPRFDATALATLGFAGARRAA
jgi:hypothetical protein